MGCICATLYTLRRVARKIKKFRRFTIARIQVMRRSHETEDATEVPVACSEISPFSLGDDSYAPEGEKWNFCRRLRRHRHRRRYYLHSPITDLIESQ